MMFQPLEDKYKWIRREFRLLDALIKDEKYISESGKKIDKKALQLWDSQLRPGVTVRLHDAEKEWMDATRNVVHKAGDCKETYEGLCKRKKLPTRIYSCFTEFQKIRGLNTEMDQIKLEILAHIVKKEKDAKDIYGSLEKSRSIVRSLQDRPIDQQHSSIYQPGVATSSVEEKINELMYENPDLMHVMQAQIDPIKWYVKPLVAFLNDLKGHGLESETEKAWVNEAEVVLGEVQSEIDSKRRTAKLSIWPMDLGRPAPLKSIVLLRELFERKIEYGFTFIRRDPSKSLPRSPQQHMIPYQINDETGILSLVDKIRNYHNIQEPTTPNELRNLSEHLEQVYGLYRDSKAIGGMKHSRKVWTDQMEVIVKDAENSWKTYTQSSASERSDSTNVTDSWPKFSAEMDHFKHDLTNLELSMKVCRTELREETNFVVGLEEDIHEVVSRLTNNIEHWSSIVPIVGMKGIGKTTLSKMVYKHTAIREHFKVFLMVPLTDTVADDNVLKIMGAQVHGTDMEQNEKEYWIKKVRHFLSTDKYLVVLDNVSTNKAWDNLKEAVPEATNGSRILVTTRFKSVALHADQGSVPHQLRLRTKNESWSLFKQMVRFQPELSGPDLSPEMQRLANKVVGRCGGLPLSIFRLGYLLSGQKVTAGELSRVLEHVNFNEAPWSETLDVNEEDLPLHLRKCLSYLGLFPRDYEIPAGRLVALWVAEGFAKQSGDEQDPPESVADKYLLELIGRNLVQLVRRKFNGKVKTCGFPSALRELWLRHNRLDQQLAYCFDESDANRRKTYGSSTNSPNILLSHRNPRSILFFDTREGNKPGEVIGNFLHKGITSGHLLQLQVLDLEHVFRPQLPNSIGKLIHLIYLGLRWTFLETIPSSIGNLENLETLDMEHTNIRTLPSSVWKLQKLQKLYMTDIYRSKIVHHRKGNSLQNLQTLQGAFVDKDSPLTDSLYKLINLTKLKMSFQLNLSQQEALVEGLVKLTLLESLKIKSIDEMGQPQDLKVNYLSRLENLSRLYLFGKLENPSTIRTISGLPQSLTNLTLSASRLLDDPMPELEKLHNLKLLSFYSSSYVGRSMVCSKLGFPQPLVLKFWMLPELEEWNVEEQALQNLKQLEIRSCKRLKIPNGLGHVKTIRELKLKDMPGEFTAKVEDNKEQIWGNIARCPAIIIDTLKGQ
nr:disease resistance rpp8-like protein 3 [Quercus suber]